MYRCVYLNHNTALLKLQGYQNIITPSLSPDTRTTNKMHTMKIIPGILNPNTPNPIKEVTEGLICQEEGEGGVPALPLAHTGGAFSARRTLSCGGQGGSEGQLPFGVSGASKAASPSSQTELSWCQSHWLLLQWAASLRSAF